MWTHETFTIEAETYEEAKKILIEAYLDDRQHDYSDCNYEQLTDTERFIRNELYDENYNPIENLMDIKND